MYPTKRYTSPTVIFPYLKGICIKLHLSINASWDWTEIKISLLKELQKKKEPGQYISDELLEGALEWVHTWSVCARLDLIKCVVVRCVHWTKSRLSTFNQIVKQNVRDAAKPAWDKLVILGYTTKIGLTWFISPWEFFHTCLHNTYLQRTIGIFKTHFNYVRDMDRAQCSHCNTWDLLEHDFKMRCFCFSDFAGQALDCDYVWISSHFFPLGIYFLSPAIGCFIRAFTHKYIIWK